MTHIHMHGVNYANTHVLNEIVHIRGISSNVKLLFSPYKKGLLLVPILKRDIIQEDHCSIQYFPLDMRIYFCV